MHECTTKDPSCLPTSVICVCIRICRADIINRGFGGYNTRMGVYLVDEILASFGAGRVRLVTVGFGANDANLPDGSNAVSYSVVCCSLVYNYMLQPVQGAPPLPNSIAGLRTQMTAHTHSLSLCWAV